MKEIELERGGLTSCPTPILADSLATGAEVGDAEHVLRICIWCLQLVQRTVLGLLLPPFIALHLVFRPIINYLADQATTKQHTLTHTEEIQKTEEEQFTAHA